MSGLIEILARTPLPTPSGVFTCIAFRHAPEPDSVHIALVHGEPAGREMVPVRVHSECFTGEVLGSSKCDCRQQLEASLEHIGGNGCGVLVYLRQEGRGIGLVNKLLAYDLQHSEGLDTVDANRRLGLPDDTRRYDAAASFLSAIAVRSVVLLTNNPSKVDGLREAGVDVRERIPVVRAPTKAAREYLATKVARMGHIVEADVDEPSREPRRDPDEAASGEPSGESAA